MKNVARKEDPIILICAAVVALGIGGWVVKSAMDMSGELSEAELADLQAPEEEMTPAEAKLIHTTELKAAVDAGNFPRWNTTESVGRERGFLVSTPLVFKGSGGQGEVLDLDKEQPVLRPPIPNEWLTRHRLESNYANVGQLDPDGDKFTNEEEYLWGEELGEEFDPNDPASHPPYYYKLVFDRLMSDPYIIEFRMVAEPNDYSLKHPPRELRDTVPREERWTDYGYRKDIPENFPDDNRNKAQERFRVESLSEPGVDPMVMTLVDTSRGEDHPKRKAEITDEGTYDFGDVYALMGYAKNEDAALKLKLLEEVPVELEGLEDYTLRLLSVDENQATVEFTNQTTDQTTTLSYQKAEGKKP